MFSKQPGTEPRHEAYTHKTTTNTKKKKKDEKDIDTSTPPNDGMVRTYSYAEISKHNKPDDLWMVLHGNVYDVSSAVESHPGGAEVLLDCGGMDATIAFDEVGHSMDSVQMLDPLFVGIVDEDGAMDSSVNGRGVPSRQMSESPGSWIYTADHGDGDGAIKNSKTGRVENVSLGESQYLRRIRQRRKKKKIKDEHLLALLTLLALLAAFAFYHLQRRKWEE